MKILYSLSQFLISEWIFSITLAFHHMVWNSIICTILLRFFAKRNWLASMFLAFSSQVCAVLSFTLIARFVLGFLFDVSFAPEEIPTLIHPLGMSFLLGVIYTGLQACFFYGLSFWQRIPVKKYALLCALSNTITAFIVYLLLPVKI